MRKHRYLLDMAFLCMILILVLIVLYSGFQILESTVFYHGQEGSETIVSKTITRNGVDYFPRQDISVIMVLGIDRTGPVEDSQSYQNRGAADMDLLMIFDETNQKCNLLYLNRDTMVQMHVLGPNGKRAGTYFGQLALAHTYGSGLEDSCENIRETISDLLYGLRIDYYIAMNMDAIVMLNDAVGGVTVNVTEDFSKVDPSIGMGRVKLMGEQAVSYVRSRKDVGDQLNLSRIERQKDYINGFAEAFKEKREKNTDFLISTYEQIQPYLVTDCSVNVINGMLNRYGDYELGAIYSPEGENVMGEKYYEFYLDEEALDALILDLFYAPKK